MILDFASLIIAESEIVASSRSDRSKLSGLGNIYYECAEGLDKRSLELLDLATSPDNDGDTKVDETFGLHLDTWMRGSVTGSFLDAYLTPRERKPYDRSSVEITEISPRQAIEDFATDTVADTVEETLNIAHEENIESWATSLIEVMELWGENSYSFRQLVSLSNLSPTEVFLGVFLWGDRFILSSPTTDFYDGFCVGCSTSTVMSGWIPYSLKGREESPTIK